MNLPAAPQSYDRANEQDVRETIRREDAKAFKQGKDVRLEQGERLIMRSPDGTQWIVGVDNTGAIDIQPL